MTDASPILGDPMLGCPRRRLVLMHRHARALPKAVFLGRSTPVPMKLLRNPSREAHPAGVRRRFLRALNGRSLFSLRVSPGSGKPVKPVAHNAHRGAIGSERLRVRHTLRM
jgi:hypothetical protein